MVGRPYDGPVEPLREESVSRPERLTGLTTFLVAALGKEVRRRLTDRLAAEGLRLQHYGLLAHLAEHGPSGQRDLSDALRTDPSDVVRIVDDLEAADYVSRHRDPRDRRRQVVELSAGGRRALRRMDTIVTRFDRSALAVLDPVERDTLHELLRRVLTADGLL